MASKRGRPEKQVKFAPTTSFHWDLEKQFIKAHTQGPMAEIKKSPDIAPINKERTHATNDQS